MSRIIDHIFSEVCLDSRIPDGIFRLDEHEHINALRDTLIHKGGLTNEDAIAVTNKMVEGKYPDRQAYRKEDGILVTWPSPKHMANAMKENPGKYTDQNPFPKDEPEPEPKRDVSSLKDSPSPTVPTEPEPKSVNQGGLNLSIEPANTDKKEELPPVPPSPAVSYPITPQRKAAEKVVVQQFIQGDNNKIPHLNPTLEENDSLTQNIRDLRNSVVNIIDKFTIDDLQKLHDYLSGNK